ncbi:MAG: sigma-54-dependent transcriptional regulator [Bacteriovoracia bacterium]
MNSKPAVLICDDDALFQATLKHVLADRFDIHSTTNPDEARAALKSRPFQVMLLDIQMRTPDDGLRALPKIRELEPDLPIIMISGRSDFHTVKEAMRLGATDYIPKNFEPDDLLIAIERALTHARTVRQARHQDFERRKEHGKHQFIGNSPAILKLRADLEKIRRRPVNVLITGETGTGKEVIARQLRGSLADGTLEPFVALDSSTIQGTMAESVLFGHERGAFTGADQLHKGVFECADGGIVYFDEIANMPLPIQVKLLRVLEEKEITRVGGTRAIPLEFRVIAASNQDLAAMVRKGEFKADLLNRLDVIQLQLPPLRDRREDIPKLAAYFCEPRTSHFTEAALMALQAYDWPGNLRELRNVMNYVLTLADGEEIDLGDLPPKVRDPLPRASTQLKAVDAIPENATQLLAQGVGFYDLVAGFEKTVLAAAYRESDQNVSQLAIKLGMDRSHLHGKLKAYGIHEAKPKPPGR